MREECRGEGVALASFDVSEVIDSTVDGEAEREFKLVWGIQATRSAPLKEFRYGEVPDGWKEDKSPGQLEVGKRYSVGPYLVHPSCR